MMEWDDASLSALMEAAFEGGESDALGGAVCFLGFSALLPGFVELIDFCVFGAVFGGLSCVVCHFFLLELVLVV